MQYNRPPVSVVASRRVIPASRAIQRYKRVVPEHIFQDYDESAEVEQYSPTAAAALARRCLESTLKDFFGQRKGTLESKIEALRDRLEPELYDALHAVRELGNWAAHHERDPEADVDHVSHEDVDKMLRVIEELFEDTYVAQARRRQLRSEVVDAADAKLA